MLLDKIIKANELIKEVHIMEEKVSLYNKSVDLKDSLVSLTSQVEKYEHMYLQFNRYKKEFFDFANLSSAIKKVEELQEGIKDRDMRFRSKVEDISKILSAEEEKLREKWSAYVRKETDDIITLLDLIIKMMDEQEKISNIQNSIKYMRRQWPLKESELADLDKVLFEARELIKNLDVSEEVQSFLVKVANRQARVSDVTPETLDWLNKNDFARNLEISFVQSRRG